MARRLKLLTGLSTLALSGAVALGAYAAEGESEGHEGHDDNSSHMYGESESEGGESEGGESEGGESEGGESEGGESEGGESEGGESEGGESEGGESEGEAASADFANDKASYLSALMIVRGHLLSGDALYAAGDKVMGSAHMRHPQAEMMTNLAPAFVAHGAEAITDDLDGLAAAAEDGADPAEVRKRYLAVKEKLKAAAKASAPTTRDTLLAVAKTISVAGEEFDIGVKDGEIINAHEYHDAHGFLKTVVDVVSTMNGANDAEQAAINLAREQAAIAYSVAPTAAPPEVFDHKSSLIYGAAARIEIAARGLDK